MKAYLILATCLLVILTTTSCSKENESKDNNYTPKSYKIYFGDKEAGYFKSLKKEDGSYFFEMEFNDRGRGPHLEETIVLDTKNHLVDLNITGVNYFKDSVSEVFTSKDGLARWESQVESGAIEIINGVFFTAINGSYGNIELLLRNILEEQDRTLELLPSGQAKISREEIIKINDTLNLKLIELNGFSFAPDYYWLDMENRLFAAVSDWSSLVPEGNSELIDDLLSIQNEKVISYYKSLSTKITEKPEGDLVIKNARIFNSKNATVTGPSTVIIKGNKIDKIIDNYAEDSEGTRVIDAAGKTLLPGLFDMHTHGSRNDGLLHIAAGVTSVRDLANSLDFPSIAQEFNDNTLIGPRVLVMSGFIDKAGPFAGPTGKIVETLEEGLEAVRFYKENDYQQIKLYSSIEPSWVKPLAEEAHRLGMRVSGHIPSYMLAEDAVRSGYDEIQHINMVALNFLSDTIDTRTPLRFSMVGKHAADIDVNDKEFTDFAALLKENEIVVDATVSIFEQLLASKPGTPNPEIAAVIDRLPIQARRNNNSGGLPIPEGMEAQYKASFDNLLAMILKLNTLGVTIVPGTDAMPGFALHTELENYVRAGLRPADVLALATINCAKVIGMESSLGSIEPGKLADLVLINGDPTENISAIRNVVLTIKDGNIYESSKIFEALGISPIDD